MPYASKEQRMLYMRDYRRKHKDKPESNITLEETDPWKELEALLGHVIDVHTSKHGFVHVHLSKEDMTKVEANTEFGRKVRP